MANTANPSGVSAIARAAIECARFDKAAEANTEKSACAIGRILGEDPTFDEWNQVHDEWVKAYISERGCTEKTAENRWCILVGSIGMEKPRKPTKEAARKAEKRSDEAERVDAAIAQHGTLKALTKAYAEASPEDAPILVKAMEKKRKAEDKAATTIAKETVKAQRDKLRKLINQIDSIKGLEAMIRLAEKFMPAEGEASQASPEDDNGPASMAGVEVSEVEDAMI